MQARIDYYKLSPEGYKAVLGLEQYLASTSLEKKLLHLIKLRVSQINGCAYCLDMHWKDLQAEGEKEQRMYSLDRRLARDSLLQRPGTRRSGLGGSSHQYHRRTRARRSLRTDAAAF